MPVPNPITGEKGAKWTSKELALLGSVYKTYGPARISRELLLHRSPDAISQKAEEMGISNKEKRGCPWSEEELKIVYELYDERHHEKSIREIAKLLPRRKNGGIASKVKKLGLSRDREWSPEEKALLEDLAETTPLKQLHLTWNSIAKTKNWRHRTKNSLEQQIAKLGFSALPLAGGWSARGLSTALGVSRSTVEKLIEVGKLKTKQLTKKSGSHYFISYRAFARFCLECPGEFHRMNLKRDNWVWVLQHLSEFCSLRSATREKREDEVNSHPD